MNPRINVVRWLCSLCLTLVFLVGTSSAETVIYYYTNGQGTPLAIADAAGNVLSSADYKPYGTRTLGSPEAGPGYTGHVNDPDSGLIYMQARYYDPSVGRFESVDPTPITPGNLFHVARYGYTNGNPISNTDPDGRDTVGQNIEQNAQAAADAGNDAATYGWAFVGAFWQVFGAESVSEVSDQGFAASSGSKAGAVLDVLAVLPPVKLGKAAVVAEQGTKAAGLVTKDGLKIEGFTRHGIDRAIGNGAERAGTKPGAMIEALKDPVKVVEKVDAQGRVSRTYVGNAAQVTINPETRKIITTNPLSREGAQ